MKKKGIVLFLLSALLFSACGTEKNKTEETDKLTVVTSFYPVYLLAQETGETITLLDPLTTAAEGTPSYIERMRRNIQAVAQHWKEAAAWKAFWSRRWNDIPN